VIPTEASEAGPIVSSPPKVSICIPAYCQVEFLRVALSSLKEQTFQDYEVIVTDDSPDHSVENLLAEFEFNGRLQYVRNEPRKGSPANWNEAVRRARGDYIKVLHHDDYFNSTDALACFVGLLDNHPEVFFAFSGSSVKDVVGGVEWHHHATAEQSSILIDKPTALFYGNFIGAPSATIYRRGVDVEYDEQLKWLVDIDFYIRLLHQYPVFSYTADALIVTPTNAGHQVTESCRASAEVELFEYHTLFTRYAGYLKSNPVAVLFYRSILEKYHVRRPKDFEAYGVEVASTADYFALVKPRHWLIARGQRLVCRAKSIFMVGLTKIIRWLRKIFMY
jgi:glycosyltransferase involved in cell wall biosynthesis